MRPLALFPPILVVATGAMYRAIVFDAVPADVRIARAISRRNGRRAP